MKTLILTRFGSTPFGTFGTLITPFGNSPFATLEPQWRKNKKGVSCIPEGLYKLALRDSPIVKRTSRGRYSQGFEVTGVPDRSLIMLHPGNWQEDSNGCILIGKGYGAPSNKTGITSSVVAFTELMDTLLKQTEPLELLIRWNAHEN